MQEHTCRDGMLETDRRTPRRGENTKVLQRILNHLRTRPAVTKVLSCKKGCVDSVYGRTEIVAELKNAG